MKDNNLFTFCLLRKRYTLSFYKNTVYKNHRNFQSPKFLRTDQLSSQLIFFKWHVFKLQKGIHKLQRRVFELLWFFNVMSTVGHDIVHAVSHFLLGVLSFSTPDQKQPPEMFCKKRCSQKFHKIRRETLVPESLF